MAPPEDRGHESPFQRLQRALGEMIAQAQPGYKFPTEPELAKLLNVSRSTLREAMRSFETQGLLIRKQGSGTFKADNSLIFESGLEVLESLETLADRLDVDISMGGLEVEHIHADKALAGFFNARAGARLVGISRVILVKGQPAAFLRDILPENILSTREIEEGFTGSVLDLLIRRGQPALEHSSAEVKVIPAPYEVARALDIQRGEALLMFEADLLAQGGKVIDHSYSWFLPGFFRFRINRRIGAASPS